MNKIIRTYRHGSNALYVRECLKNQGVFAIIDEETHDDGVKFCILIKEQDLLKAEQIILDLKIDDGELDTDSEGYLAGYYEWTGNMYNPGHYTGGKIPHYLMDKDNWKVFGPLFLILGLYIIARYFKDGISVYDLETLIFSLLYVIAGYNMMKQLRKRKKLKALSGDK